MNETFDTTKALSVTALLLVIGGGLKYYVPFLPNRFIPLVTLILGVGGYLIWTGDYSASSIVAALYAALAATGAHSSSKSLTEKPVDTAAKEAQPPKA